MVESASTSAWQPGAFLARLASSAWAYPALEALHIVGIALLVGGLALFELRVWGVAPALPPHELARVALGTSLAGFALAAASGLAMYATEPAGLLANPAFRIKLALLALAGANAARVPRPRRHGAARPRRPLAGAGVDRPVARRRRLRPLDRLCLKRRRPPCNAQTIVPARRRRPAARSCATRSALAHHGWSGFDQDRPLYLEGSVARVRWAQPARRARAGAAEPSRRCPPT